MKKTSAILLIVLVLSVFLGAAVPAFASFGSGVATLTEDAKIIKTGLFGRKIVFSDTDFKQGLCIGDFESIRITKLPASTEGTLMLAGRRVSEGMTIKRKNIPSLVFIPASKDVKECKFLFTIDGFANDAEVEFILKFTDKINYEPEIDKENSALGAMKTQREIGIYGKLEGKDKEGDALEYMIVAYPKSGTLELLDKENGEFLYTPPAQFIGEDKFTYVVRDEWGNFSTAETVSVTVTERLSEVKYRDMSASASYNAAVVMTALGVMNGRVIGDGTYFEPEKTVSRAEFVAMAMKATGARADTTLSSTFFDDDADIPEALRGYVATAQRTGIIVGDFENGKLLFKPNDAITKYKAAAIMAKLTSKKSDTAEIPVFNDISSVPKWARDSVYTMCALGVFDTTGEALNGNTALSRESAAEYLYRLIA